MPRINHPGNEYFDLATLKLLYGRTRNGATDKKRTEFKMTAHVMDSIRYLIPAWSGYRNHFIEMSVRLMIGIVGNGEDLDQIANEIKICVISPYLINNLKRLIRILEA